MKPKAILTVLGIVVMLQARTGQPASPPDANASPALRVVSRTVSANQPMMDGAVYPEQTGLRLISHGHVSEDNGLNWQPFTPKPNFSAGLPHGYRREEVTSVVDPNTRRFLTVLNALDLPGLDPKIVEPPIAQKNYYLRYRVSTDGGRSWLFDEPILQAGDFTAQHPCDGVWIGKNAVYLGDRGCIPIVTRAGEILVPAQLTPLAPDDTLWNPSGGFTYTDILVFIGAWTEDHRLRWQVSERVQGDPARSTRGMDEATLAEFPDGRILMVMRGANGDRADPNFKLPSRRWFSISTDGGKSWTKPDVWTYDDGQAFFSPSAMSTLFRHSSGRNLWVGNIAAENCRGNSPRWPVVLGEVEPQSLKLVRQSMLTIDTRQKTDESQGRLDLCHFALFEDRQTKEIVLTYPRGHGGYKTREWATVRIAVVTDSPGTTATGTK